MQFQHLCQIDTNETIFVLFKSQCDQKQHHITGAAAVEGKTCDYAAE